MSAQQDLPVIAFASRDAWEAWLAEQHAISGGIWLKLAKKASGIESVTYAEALDVALCYGWIDGLKYQFDGNHWLQRFTPRRPRSKWSRINCDKATNLIRRGKMKPAGLQEIEKAKADGRWDAAYEGQRVATIPPDLQRELDRNDEARAFFATLSGTNRYAILYRIQDAKRPETRAQRIATYVEMLAAHRTIYSETASKGMSEVPAGGKETLIAGEGGEATVTPGQIRFRPLGEDLLLITLSRPEKRNALTLPMIEQLTREIAQAGPGAARGVVLAGEGPSFCAGVDLHEFADGSPESGRALIGALRELCSTVRALPKPVACAIQGHCLGGALELAACCDFRICTSDAQLGMPEVFLGIPSVIDAVMLEHHVGAGRARELLLTGEPVNGETAYQWGLVNRLATSEELIDAAAGLVRRATQHDPDVIAEQKRLHEQWLNLPYEQAVEQSMEALVDAFRAGRPQRIANERLRR